MSTAVPAHLDDPRLPRTQAAHELTTRWSGEITWRTTAHLRDDLYNLLESSGSTMVRLDVSAVTGIDGAGIAVLIGANHRAAAMGLRLVLIDRAGPVTTSLRRMHLLSKFQVTQVISST